MRIFLIVCAVAAALAGAPRASAASVIINEFLAENDGGLVDQNGDTPDWIELFNTAGAPVNLGGWYLTDTPTNLTKWTFPPTNLPAGGFLIVFASGKDRATNGAQLHTNFQLDNSGGYLALVDSNGVVVSYFNYPAQHRNVSFGPGTTNASATTLLAASSAVQWLVPASGALGNSWTLPAFNASAWSNAVTPLRYDVGFVGGGAGAPVLSVDFNDRDSNTVAFTQSGFSAFISTNFISNTTIQTNPTTRNFGGMSVTLSNSGAFGYDDRARATPVNGGALTQDAIYKDVIFSRDTSGTSGFGPPYHRTGRQPAV